MTPRRCDELRLFVERFRGLERWLRDYRDDVAMLIRDQELQSSGIDGARWQLHFAVDFREVYAYAFPFADLLRQYEAVHQDTPYLRELALAYLARACLFRKATEIGPLVLLPPYRHELNYNLMTLARSRLDATRLKSLANVLTQKLNAPMRDLRTAEGKAGADAKATDGASRIVALLEQHYTDLTLLLLADSADSMQKLRFVLGGRVVAPDVECRRWPAVAPEDVVLRWQTRLAQRRGGTRERQTLRDAEALALVEAANEPASRGESRDLVCADHKHTVDSGRGTRDLPGWRFAPGRARDPARA